MCLDSGGDFLIDGGLDGYRDLTHFRGDLSDVLHDGKNSLEKGLEIPRLCIHYIFWEVVRKKQAMYE